MQASDAIITNNLFELGLVLNNEQQGINISAYLAIMISLLHDKVCLKIIRSCLVAWRHYYNPTNYLSIPSYAVIFSSKLVILTY